MKILFYQGSDVINSSGGTEKVLCFLSSTLAEEGYDIAFMTNEKKSGRPFFKLSDKVKFINVGGTKFSGIRKAIFKLIKIILFIFSLTKLFLCVCVYFVTYTALVMEDQPVFKILS